MWDDHDYDYDHVIVILVKIGDNRKAHHESGFDYYYYYKYNRSIADQESGVHGGSEGFLRGSGSGRGCPGLAFK